MCIWWTHWAVRNFFSRSTVKAIKLPYIQWASYCDWNYFFYLYHKLMNSINSFTHLFGIFWFPFVLNFCINIYLFFELESVLIEFDNSFTCYRIQLIHIMYVCLQMVFSWQPPHSLFVSVGTIHLLNSELVKKKVPPLRIFWHICFI